MKPETPKVDSDPPVICRTGCGFYGRRDMDGLCSVCYKATVKAERGDKTRTQNGSNQTETPPVENKKEERTAETSSPNLDPPTDTENHDRPVPTSEVLNDAKPSTEGETSESEKTESVPEEKKKRKRNCCGVCQKNLGLTGIECRCGGIYCGLHRYSDTHECTFDYRAMGAEEIQRNNPAVKPSKIRKI